MAAPMKTPSPQHSPLELPRFRGQFTKVEMGTKQGSSSGQNFYTAEFRPVWFFSQFLPIDLIANTREGV
jgi:hypothetical protein